MDPRRSHELTRYGAPAAFLAAVTIAVVLIKAGLNGNSNSESATVGALPTSSLTTTETTTPGAQYYVVQSGDTLGSVAQKYSTTVEKLLTLNPGVDPTALHIGQRLRVQ